MSLLWLCKLGFHSLRTFNMAGATGAECRRCKRRFIHNWRCGRWERIDEAGFPGRIR